MHHPHPMIRRLLPVQRVHRVSQRGRSAGRHQNSRYVVSYAVCGDVVVEAWPASTCEEVVENWPNLLRRRRKADISTRLGKGHTRLPLPNQTRPCVAVGQYDHVRTLSKRSDDVLRFEEGLQRQGRPLEERWIWHEAEARKCRQREA